MSIKKLFKIPNEVNSDNFEEVMNSAITLELATIPTYLSTYYSINRAQDQDALYDKLKSQLITAGRQNADALAQELKEDILVYANQSAALIMSVVVEEMLHLALACNVKQATVAPPDLMAIGKVLNFPTQLDGHEPEFPINTAKLSMKQLSTFLQIESPEPFVDSADKKAANNGELKYKTIGQLYNMIIEYVKGANIDYRPYSQYPQLLPPETGASKRPYYSQNSINTVYYDRDHQPQFGSEDDSGELVAVANAQSATIAMNVIQDQGEGNTKDDQDLLTFDSNNMPVPLPVVDGEVQFKDGDYDDPSMTELSHFSKFMEVYSLGGYYQKKFKDTGGLDDFFSYFVYDQTSNPKQEDYDASGNEALALCSQLGNAIFTYILLMVETCYYQEESVQFEVFMYGVHKSMIWLLSGVGNEMHSYTFEKDGKTCAGSLTFEYYPFDDQDKRPKAQILELVDQLAKVDPTRWSWLTDPKYDSYWPSLPDVGLDHSVTPDVPHIPA